MRVIIRYPSERLVLARRWLTKDDFATVEDANDLIPRRPIGLDLEELYYTSGYALKCPVDSETTNLVGQA